MRCLALKRTLMPSEEPLLAIIDKMTDAEPMGLAQSRGEKKDKMTDRQEQGRIDGTQLQPPHPYHPGENLPREHSSQHAANDEHAFPLSPAMSHYDKIIITWDGPNDPENPFNWPSSKKWRVTLLACLMTFISSISGTALAPTAPQLSSTFNLAPDATSTIPPTYYPIFTWTLAAGVIPLILLPVMETYGIRLPYLLCLLTLILTTLPQALSPPSAYGLLLAIRVLTGGAAGVLQNVTGGIIGDVWAGPLARSRPVALYIYGLVAGLMIGPVIGGAITWGTTPAPSTPSSTVSTSTLPDASGLSWRWVPWTQLIAYTLSLPLIYALLPETRGSAILALRAARLRATTGDAAAVRTAADNDHAEKQYQQHSPAAETLRHAIGRPLRMLLTEPLVACSALWSAFCFGNALLFTQSIPRVYGDAYGWEAWRSGLVQGALVVGITLGLVLSPLQDRWYANSNNTATRSSPAPITAAAGHDPEKNNATPAEGRGDGEEAATPVPEARLALSIPLSFLGLAGGLFVYAWTARPHVHWLAPTSGLVLVGVGIFAVVAAASNYVEDAYSLYAASALAGVAFGENMTGALLPLAERALYTNLGAAWASSLLGFVALGLSFAPVVLRWKGEVIRARSPFIREAMYETTQGSSDPTLA